jgi:hypothetical protein
MEKCDNCDSDVMNEYPNHECKKCVEQLRIEIEEKDKAIAKLNELYIAKRGGGCACILNEDGESFASMCIVHKKMFEEKDKEIERLKGLLTQTTTQHGYVVTRDPQRYR